MHVTEGWGGSFGFLCSIAFRAEWFGAIVVWTAFSSLGTDMNAASIGSNLQSLTCDCCGASIEFTDERFATCPYCGQAYNLSELRSPRRGELLLGADLCDPNLPGWRVYQKDSLLFGDGGQRQLVGNFRKQESTACLVESCGSFDNIDASVTISFLEVEDITKTSK
jgi:uncharacterized Zn-finger protein